ncbi:MAG: 3-hydroxybutyrate dehydrogenase [Bacteroidetes bacterium]|nr:3-hydroxybutyrate dehydrogenase [Bacteroidota bacterium]
MIKTVLITGSTSGIGKAIATLFASKGCHVIFNGLENNGAEIAQTIADEYKIKHLFFPVNLLDRLATKAMIAKSIETFGSIDILINNAGIQFVSPVEDFPEEKWDDIININLSSAFILTKAVWHSMKQKQFGRIINIASAHGFTASPFKSAYIASKHAMIGFTKAIALEGAPLGITCNAICPGYVHTPIVENQIENQMKAHGISRDEVIKNVMLGKQPIKEFINIDVIAELAWFIAQDSSRTITGASFPIDGGWTAE